MPAQTTWRYLVIFASFMQLLLTVGPLYNFNVFLLPLQTEFKTSAVFTGWVGSLGNALLCMIAPPTAVLAWKIGNPRVVIIGNFLTTAGYLATSFISSLAQGFVTFGLMAGIGSGFMYCGSMSVLCQWYLGRTNNCRPTAAAIIGSSVGVMVFGPLLNTLTASYGWRNSFRVLSGIVLTMGVVTALPLLKSPESGDEGQQSDETDVKIESLPAEKTEQSGESDEEPRRGSTDPKTGGDPGSEDPVRSSTSAVKFVCEIVLNVEVWLWISSITITQLGWSFVIIHYSSFLDGLGLTTGNISVALTVLGAAEIVGKIVVALIGDRLPFLKLYLIVVTSVIAAIVSGFLPFCTTFWSIIVMSIIWGYCRGTIFAVSLAATIELFEMYGAGAVVAVGTSGFGIGVLIGSPITGAFYDMTGNYTLSLFAVVASFGAGSVCALLIPIKRRLVSRCCRNASKNINNNTEDDETKVDPAEMAVETRSVGTSNPAYDIEI